MIFAIVQYFYLFFSIVLSAAPKPRLHPSSPGRRSRPASATSARRTFERRWRRRNTRWSCSTHPVRTRRFLFYKPWKKKKRNRFVTGPVFIAAVLTRSLCLFKLAHAYVAAAASGAAHSQFINTNDVMRDVVHAESFRLASLPKSSPTSGCFHICCFAAYLALCLHPHVLSLSVAPSTCFAKGSQWHQCLGIILVMLPMWHHKGRGPRPWCCSTDFL